MIIGQCPVKTLSRSILYTNACLDPHPIISIYVSILLLPADQAVMVFEQPQTFKDAQTQWMDPAEEDHTYSKGSILICDMIITPAPEISLSIAEVTLKGDKDCLLYTGIPLPVFNTHVSCLRGFVRQSSTMPAQDEVLLTLMKLRHNFAVADLARRFKRSASQVSKTLTHWVDILAEHTRDLIPWLPRDTIKATMPKVFLPHFSDLTCIIDCTESVLQKAKNLDSRSESYSHYYASNTVKYLVAIAPSGMLMFISEAFGGKCSDRYITQNSGFLDFLRPGDVVMGDRGFTIRDLVEERRVRLVIPAFTRKRSQLTNEQVTQMRRIANVRIHVERAIRRLKVFKILSQTVPISLVPKIDKILQICAALINLRGELISSN